MPAPTYTTTRGATPLRHTFTHEIIHRKPDYLDILTLVLPAITFIAGYFLNSLVEKRKEKKRLQRVSAYFFSLVEILESAMRRQAKALQDAAKRIDTLNGDSFAISLVTSLRTERIKAIPDLDLFTLFIRGNQQVSQDTNQLNAVSDAIDLVDDVKRRIVEINTGVFEQLTAFGSRFEVDIRDFVAQYREIVLRKQEGKVIDPETDKFVNSSQEHLKEKFFNTQGPRQLSGVQPFIEPLYEASRVIIPNKHNTPMLALVAKIYGDYKTMVGYQAMISGEQGVLANIIESARTELNRAIVELKK